MAHAYSICKPGNSGAPKSNLVDSSIIAKNNRTDRAEARQLASASWVEFMRTPSAKDMTWKKRSVLGLPEEDHGLIRKPVSKEHCPVSIGSACHCEILEGARAKEHAGKECLDGDQIRGAKNEARLHFFPSLPTHHDFTFDYFPKN